MIKFIPISLFSLLAGALFGCANLPQRTYSFSFTNSIGQTVSAGVSMGGTQGLKK